MKMSSPSSLSPSAMSDTPASGSSVAGKGGGFRSELAAIFAVVIRTDVAEVGAARKRKQASRATPAGHSGTLGRQGRQCMFLKLSW